MMTYFFPRTDLLVAPHSWNIVIPAGLWADHSSLGDEQGTRDFGTLGVVHLRHRKDGDVSCFCVPKPGKRSENNPMQEEYGADFNRLEELGYDGGRHAEDRDKVLLKNSVAACNAIL